MSWVLLDDKFHANPKVTSVGNKGAGLYARALSYCGDNLTDGFVEAGWAREVGGAPLCKKLAEVGLWINVQGGEVFVFETDAGPYTVSIPGKGFFIVDYLTMNPTRSHVELQRGELRKKRSEAGKKGAEARWGDGKADSKSDGKAYGKPHGTPNGKPIANEWQTPWQPDGPTPLPLKDQDHPPNHVLQDEGGREGQENGIDPEPDQDQDQDQDLTALLARAEPQDIPF